MQTTIYVLLIYLENLYRTYRLASMWQLSGTLLICSCHGIAGFLVDELQI